MCASYRHVYAPSEPRWRQRRSTWGTRVGLITLIVATAVVLLYLAISYPRGLGKVLKGHTDWIQCVACSSDGKTIATGSRDQTIRLWDLATGQMQATLRGHQGEVASVCFSPNGKLLASAGYDGIVRVWNVATRHEKCALKGSGDLPVLAVAFSPAGDIVASGGREGTVRIWDINANRIRGVFGRRPVVILSLVFTPDGKNVVAIDKEGTITGWDVSTGTEVWHVGEGGVGSSYRLALSPDGKTLAATTPGLTVQLLDMSTRQMSMLESKSRLPVCSVAFSPDGKLVAASDLSAQVRFWDVAKRKLLCTHHIGQNTFAIAFSADGKLLATGGADCNVSLWDLGTMVAEN
jgi:WD40 repeat protein